MATEALDGLFGPTPDQIQAQQNTALQQGAAAYANQSPLQRAAAGMYQAGGMLGGAAANAMGMVNPQQQLASQTQILQKGINHSTPEGLMAGAQQLKDVNPGLAAKYVQASQALKMQNSKMALEDAQAKKALAYQPTGYGNTKEYQDQVDIVTDPDSTPEEVQFAKDRIAALNAKKTGGSGGNSNSVTVKNMIVDGQPVTVRIEKGIGGRTEVVKQDGTVMTPAEYSPELIAKVAAAKSGGVEIGKASAGAQIDLIDAEPMAEVQLRQLDQLLAHPGLSGAVGLTLPMASKIPGSKEADFAARFDQIKGGVFLQAFKSLRGGGQITDVEGQKATQALLRAQTSQSENEFKDAVREYMGVIRTGLDRLKKKAALTPTSPITQTMAPPAEPAPTQSATPPMSGVTTPQQVKSLYQGGKLTKAQANAILDDMKSRGLF
jgi:hypothetical protein